MPSSLLKVPYELFLAVFLIAVGEKKNPAFDFEYVIKRNDFNSFNSKEQESFNIEETFEKPGLKRKLKFVFVNMLSFFSGFLFLFILKIKHQRK